MTWQRESLILKTVSFLDTNHDSKAWLRTCDQYEWRSISAEQDQRSPQEELWRTRRRWRTSTGVVSWSFWLDTRSMMINIDRRMMRLSTRRLKDETFADLSDNEKEELDHKIHPLDLTIDKTEDMYVVIQVRRAEHGCWTKSEDRERKDVVPSLSGCKELFDTERVKCQVKRQLLVPDVPMR